MKNTANQLDQELCFVSDKLELLFAVELVLPGLHTVETAVNTIQDVHFDDLGGTGFFRLMSPHSKHHTPEYVMNGDRIIDNLSDQERKEVLDYSVSQNADSTTVKIILNRIEFESLEEEYEALFYEFEAFAETEKCISWKQLPLNLPAKYTLVNVHYSQSNEQVHIEEIKFSEANILDMAKRLNELQHVNKNEKVDFLILKENSETVIAQGAIELSEIV